MGLHIGQTFASKIKLTVTTLVLTLAIVAQPYVNLLPAFAAEHTVVTKTNLEGWNKYGNVEPEFVVDSSAPSGSGALKLSTPTGSQYVQIDRDAVTTSLASDLDVSYDTKALAGSVHAAPAYVVAIDKDGATATTNDVFWAWYEPVYNNAANKDYSQWNTWNITAASNFWYNGAKPAEAIGYTSPLNTVISHYPAAKVIGFTLNMGTGNEGWSALVDNVKTTEATYDFEPTVQTNSSVTVTGNTASAENQPGWLFNRDASSATPFEFSTSAHSVGNGSLYVKPIGTNLSDKFIAEYFAKTAVSDLNSFSYDFKIAGNGSSASANNFYTSVYVNSVNDDKYYDCRYDYAPLVGSTSGFTNFSFNSSTSPAQVTTHNTSRIGTCPATMTALPAGSYIRAFAINVGQSNDSDVGLAGFIDNVALDTVSARTTSDFELIGAPQNLAPGNGSYTSNDSFDNTWSTVSGAAKYEYETTYNVAPGYYRDTSDSENYVISSNVVTRHNNGAPEATYTWHVRAINANGQPGPWSEYSNVTVDKTKPSVPTSLSWKTSTNVTIQSGSYTNLNNGTATWGSDTSADFDHYVYKYWNDISGNQYKVGSEYSAYPTTASLGGSFTEGDGVHHFCVVAVDKAGNESDCSTPFTVGYDSVAPQVSIATLSISPQTQPLSGNKITADGSATDSNFNYYYCYVTNALGNEVGVRDSLCQTTWAAGTPFQTAFTPAANGQPAGVLGSVSLAGDTPYGQYTFHIIAKDKAGNTSSEVTKTFEITEPEAVIVQPAPDPIISPVVTPASPSNQGGASANSQAGRNSTTPAQPAAARTFLAVANTPANDGTTVDATDAADTAVLGVNDNKTNSTDASDTSADEADVLGTNDTKQSGVAWYWWLALAALVVGFIWWIAGRRKSDDNNF